MITAEQARLIFDIYRELGIGCEWFNPKVLYPHEFQETDREIIGGLVNAGLAEQNRNKSIRLTERALKAYDEWVQAKRFEKMRRVWFKSVLGGTCSALITITGPIEQAKIERILQADPDFMGISMV